MSLALFTPMLERVKKLGIQPRQAGQILGVQFVVLALVAVDEPQFTGIGHQHLVAAPLQKPAHPGRVGSHLDGDAQMMPLGTEPTFEGFRGGAQPTLFQDLATLSVSTKHRLAVAVSQIHSDCHPRLSFATITHGPILLSFGPLM
jgi:hypothetical protein